MKFMVCIYSVFFCALVPAFAGGLDLSGVGKLNSSDLKIATKVWPKMKKAMPGLDAYAQDIKIIEVEKSQSVKGLTFHFLVSDRPQVIPAVFLAKGHNCFVDVDYKGKKATIAKRACISAATMINAFDPALSASLGGGPLVLDLD